MKRARCGSWALLVVVLQVLPLERGSAQGTFVMPSRFATQMGGSVAWNPIFMTGLDPNGLPFRYQEAFGSDDISLPYGQYYIAGVNFRLAQAVAGGNSLSAVLPDIEFRMSTTRRAGVDRLSGEFDLNPGPDMAVVVPRGPLHVTGTFDPSKPVQEFSVHVPFTEPFLYNRVGFDLLLDIINYGGSPIAVKLDSAASGLGSVSLVAGSSLTSGTALGYGMVAQFDYQLIPEPRVMSLVAMAFGLGLFGRGRNVRNI